MPMQASSPPNPCATFGTETEEKALQAQLCQVLDGGPAAIADRLEALDREWTSGRATKATAGVVIVVGVALAAVFGPWWLLLSAVGGLMLMQYLFGRRSIVGGIFHTWGLRSGAEIDREKTALKALRGDFQQIPTVHQIEAREDISRLEGEGGIVYDPDNSKVEAQDAVREVLGATRK